MNNYFHIYYYRFIPSTQTHNYSIEDKNEIKDIIKSSQSELVLLFTKI